MDLGEFGTGIESPFIPVVLWVLFAAGLITSLLVTLIAARRGNRRPAVLLIGWGMLVLALATGLILSHRYDLAGVVGSQLCPRYPDGVYFVGDYLTLGDEQSGDPFASYRACLSLQYRIAAWTLGGYLLVVVTSAVVQRGISRPSKSWIDDYGSRM